MTHPVTPPQPLPEPLCSGKGCPHVLHEQVVDHQPRSGLRPNQSRRSDPTPEVLPYSAGQNKCARPAAPSAECPPPFGGRPPPETQVAPWGLIFGQCRRSPLDRKRALLEPHPSPPHRPCPRYPSPRAQPPSVFSSSVSPSFRLCLLTSSSSSPLPSALLLVAV